MHNDYLSKFVSAQGEYNKENTETLKYIRDFMIEQKKYNKDTDECVKLAHDRIFQLEQMFCILGNKFEDLQKNTLRIGFGVFILIIAIIFKRV